MAKHSRKRTYPKRRHTRKHTQRYAKSINTRIKHSKSKCARYNQKNCGSIDPNCRWRKRTGCVRSKGKRNSPVYEGPLQA